MKTELKYSPKNLNEVVYPNPATEMRIKAYAENRLQGNILLYGPNGTGKTTVAELLALSIAGDKSFIEIKNPDDVFKGKSISNYIATAGSYARLNGSKYVMVFHEFDNYKDRPNELWMALDKYADQVCLIATTNNPMSIHQSLRSRCKEIEFPAISAHQMLPRALQILNAEGINLSTDELLNYLVEVEYRGSLREYCRQIDEIFLLATEQRLPLASHFKPNTFKPKLSIV